MQWARDGKSWEQPAMCAGTGRCLRPFRGLLVPQCGPHGWLRGVVQLTACTDHFLTSPKPGATLEDRGSSFQYRQTLCGTVWFCPLPQRKCVKAECPGSALEQCKARDTRVLQQHRGMSLLLRSICAAQASPVCASPTLTQPPWQGRLPLNIDGV